jgi:hypothetical protein
MKIQWTVQSHSVTPYDDTTDFLTLYLKFTQKSIVYIFSDIDVWTFQSKAGSTNIGGAFAAAQIAGFNDQVVKFSGTTTLIATFLVTGFQWSQ